MTSIQKDSQLWKDSARYCLKSTRQHAKSFYFCSFPLPKEKKLAAFGIYAFCRYADDLVDQSEASGQGIETALEGLERFVDEAVMGKSVETPAFAPIFAWAVQNYSIEKGLFLDLIRGVRMDLDEVRIPDWNALRTYCYYVASVVGLIMSRVFELRNDEGIERAIDLGLAMQLTNIIRDVGEDFARDRVYLPAAELKEYGVTLADLGGVEPSDKLKSLLQFQIARARDYYVRSEQGIAWLSQDGSQFTVWLMRHVYAGILDDVEKRDYNVLSQRAHTTLGDKISLAYRAWQASKRS
ncbi:MAG: phytoene/squalene synthase family protein [Verrucomicrobiales bacterium]